MGTIQEKLAGHPRGALPMQEVNVVRSAVYAPSVGGWLAEQLVKQRSPSVADDQLSI